MPNHFHGRDFLNIRNRAMLALFFDTGMRLQEVLTLRMDQVQEEYILVHGKGNKERVVPVSPYLAKALHQYNNARESYFEHYDRLPEKMLFSIYNQRSETCSVRDSIWGQCCCD